jgi:ribosome biogenesis GTPase YqeH
MSKEKKYCIGCGVLLQDENMTMDGYTTSLENDICSRCFRMKNYGEYQIVTKSNEEYIDILKSVNKTNDLVLYIVDLLNLDKDLKHIRNYINNKVILVLSKRDVLPKSVKDEKLIEYFKKIDLDYDDIIVVSPNKNYNIDELLHMIKKYKTSKNVYVVGHTNVGKSTLINKLMKNYSENDCELTISPLPSTTLNKISIKLSDDLTLIDTPGLIDRGNIVNYVDTSLLKRINPKKEIKPKTYQIKKGQCLVIGDLVRIDYVEGDKNSFTVFMSNDLKVQRYNLSRQDKLKDLYANELDVLYHEDVVVNGLGFVKIVEKAKVVVYIDKNVEVYTRRSLI